MLPVILGLIRGFLPVLFLLIAFCVTYFGGDDGDPRQTRCKALARKLRYYDNSVDMRYLPTYINILMPLLTVYIAYFVVESIIRQDVISYLVLLIALAAQIFGLILIRGIDKAGFAFNVVAIIAAGAAYLYISRPISWLWLMNFAIAMAYMIYHIKYFSDRKDLFFKSAAELKRELDE